MVLNNCVFLHDSHDKYIDKSLIAAVRHLLSIKSTRDLIRNMLSTVKYEFMQFSVMCHLAITYICFHVFHIKRYMLIRNQLLM